MLLRACFCISVVRELAELHKANASRASEAEEAALSRDTQAKEKMSLALEKAQEEARIQQEALADQVTHHGTVSLLCFEAHKTCIRRCCSLSKKKSSNVSSWSICYLHQISISGMQRVQLDLFSCHCFRS